MDDADIEDFEPDEIGDWTERKIRIVSKYAKPYSQIISSKNLRAYYIDGFSGGGVHIRKETGERVLSTARRILQIEPRFERYIFVDFDPHKAQAMQRACNGRDDAQVICADANMVLPSEIFPQVRYDEYKRALCFLDPYKMLLDWQVLKAAASTRAIEVFIHFPTVDVQRNALRHDRSKVRADDRARMTAMWGDASWESIAYANIAGLFGPIEERQPIDKLIEEFRMRLKKLAGFKFVSKALPMLNRKNGIVYHLIFATQNETAVKIATEIMEAEQKPHVYG